MNISPRPKPFRAQLLVPLVAIILLGANAGIGMLLINASTESQVSLSHLEALKRNQQNQQQLQADLLTHQNSIATLQSVLPPENQIPEFIQFIIDSGKQANVDLNFNFSTNQPTKTPEGLFVIPFMITYQGDATKVGSVIASLHQGIYQVRFKHVDVQGTNQTQPANIRLEGEVYVASPSMPNK